MTYMQASFRRLISSNNNPNWWFFVNLFVWKTRALIKKTQILPTTGSDPEAEDLHDAFFVA